MPVTTESHCPQMVVARLSSVLEGTSATDGAARAVVARNPAVRRAISCMVRECNERRGSYVKDGQQKKESLL